LIPGRERDFSLLLNSRPILEPKQAPIGDLNLPPGSKLELRSSALLVSE
jgi:hypothetical protein